MWKNEILFCTSVNFAKQNYFSFHFRIRVSEKELCEKSKNKFVFILKMKQKIFIHDLPAKHLKYDQDDLHAKVRGGFIGPLLGALLPLGIDLISNLARPRGQGIEGSGLEQNLEIKVFEDNKLIKTIPCSPYEATLLLDLNLLKFIKKNQDTMSRLTELMKNNNISDLPYSGQNKVTEVVEKRKEPNPDRMSTRISQSVPAPERTKGGKLLQTSGGKVGNLMNIN